MRKFKRPIASYELGRYKPMAIELDASGLGRYRDLANNPIYYYGAIQYKGGGFYRAVLGYEVLWDRGVEDDLVLGLDYVLHKHDAANTYYIEEIAVSRNLRLHGVKWPRALPPTPLFFDMQWPIELLKGEKLTARVNLLDKPNHVDIERQNGEVFTIAFMRYRNYIATDTFKRKKGDKHGRQTKTASKTNASRTGQGLSLVKRPSRKIPVRTLPNELLSVRKRVGEPDPL